MPGDGFGQLLGRFGGCQTGKVKRGEPRCGGRTNQQPLAQQPCVRHIVIGGDPAFVGQHHLHP